MTGDDEAGVVVLKSNGVRIVAPVIQVLGELRCLVLTPVKMRMSTHGPFPSPFDYNIVDNGVEASCNPVGLILREDDLASVAAFMEGFQNIRDIVFMIAICFDGADIRTRLDHCCVGSTC